MLFGCSHSYRVDFFLGSKEQLVSTVAVLRTDSDPKDNSFSWSVAFLFHFDLWHISQTERQI